MDGLAHRTRRLLFPRHCLLCQANDTGQGWICRYCRYELPQIRSACPVCGLPGSMDTVCGQCHANPPEYQLTIAPFEFKKPVSTLIYRLKYQDAYSLALALAHEICRHTIRAGTPRPDVFIPVPLHPKRLRQRGFNQSLLLAKALARNLDLPCYTQGLLRRRYAQPQVELDARQRKLAVRNAFSVKGCIPATHVALVDDVISTGNTVNQAARAIQKAGAGTVSIWAVARNT